MNIEVKNESRVVVSNLWYITSTSDPRWNAHGETSNPTKFFLPLEGIRVLEELKDKLGAIPADFKWGYM